MSRDPEARSLSFDRAAEYYDATRGRPDEIAQGTELLAAHLAGPGPVLEVGVGTGRLALPLRERGFEVVGIDLSLEMMRKLRAKEGGAGMPLAQADATRLPFPDATFGGAYAVWVLHLIPTWRGVLDELVRTMRPGASLVVARGGRFGAGPWGEMEAEFRRVTGARLPGPDDLDEVDREMAARGCIVHELPTVTTIGDVTPRELLRRLSDNQHSFTWVLDEPTLQRGVEHTRRWAVERYGDLDKPTPNESGAQWRLYVVPS